MKMYHFLTALPVVFSLAMPLAAQAQTSEGSAAQVSRHQFVGREVAAPPWSAACMSDQGPSQCGEPMWVYGSPRSVDKYKSAF